MAVRLKSEQEYLVFTYEINEVIKLITEIGDCADSLLVKPWSLNISRNGADGLVNGISYNEVINHVGLKANNEANQQRFRILME